MGDRDYHLAVSGDVFRWLMDYGSSETLHRVGGMTLPRYIVLTMVYSSSYDA